MVVRQSYGTADVGCMGYECFQKNGMHFPYNCIVEIVDPETGKQVKPGETGEIVTTVFDEVYPMIRFGTGDLSYYTDEPCACGRTSGRIMKILGRLDQAIVRPPLQKLEEDEIAKLKKALVAAGLQN